MEPMALESAPSSPASPGINTNFLPGFLMGEQHQNATPNLSSSPGRNRTPNNTFKMGLTAEPQSLRQKLFNQSMNESPAPHSPFVAVSEKAGPPKMGLFDSLEQSKKPTSPILSSTVANLNDSMVVCFNQSNVSRIHPEESLNYSSRNVTNVSVNDSFVNKSGNSNIQNRLEKIDSHWVTVFGFPPSALAFVLSNISNCGVIVDKRVPSQGNWVHLKFSNYTEVARVLSLNGKCINNSIMIGVHLYHDKKDNKENLDNTVYTSPVRARSLRHSFVSPQAAMVVSPQALPQKSTGIVTKAMEYVFGW